VKHASVEQVTQARRKFIIEISHAKLDSNLLCLSACLFVCLLLEVSFPRAPEQPNSTHPPSIGDAPPLFDQLTEIVQFSKEIQKR